MSYGVQNAIVVMLKLQESRGSYERNYNSNDLSMECSTCRNIKKENKRIEEVKRRKVEHRMKKKSKS